MKKEHFIQALKHNGIEVVMHQEGERAGVLKHSEFISTTYYENDEVIQSFQIFWAGLASKDPTVQLKHSTDILKVIDKTVELITGTRGTEVLALLGVFNQPLDLPKLRNDTNYVYKVEAVQGLMALTVSELDTDRPPIES